MSYCFIIPNYNHIHKFSSFINKLIQYKLPIIVINDGSDTNTELALRTLATEQPSITLLHHQRNLGKGAAVQTGLSYAYQQGFSHALQVDADGQHDLNDIDTFINLSKASPLTLISGTPMYDESIPKHRYFARYITHVWVYIETLSLQVKDSMCGFRVYPLAAYNILSDKVALGNRMDFDTEVLVRLYWQNCPITFVPTKVIYPEDGSSHFRPLEDNIRISWMHTRLFFGMLIRSPALLYKNIKRWLS
ncbi:glycosyltransferase family 2 protein [Colwellia sp. D2M02]|uniref:glycosyltransferase family 2 protein n=1 Tax=Colwellia sp. D2M02 TaxID=2841562 RepID=UPI001C09FBBC|nr:glycosyltransferase family 2 protein [Colwellia sp. D2M02]MBU2892002.1 glycosyltransferase family 2 protein [Colwellia sp. D2M02]